jgi:hypothetical protein
MKLVKNKIRRKKMKRKLGMVGNPVIPALGELRKEFKDSLGYYIMRLYLKITKTGWVQWLMSIIPATQEAEIRRITVQVQPRQNVSKIPSQQKIIRHVGMCLWSQLCENNR